MALRKSILLVATSVVSLILLTVLNLASATPIASRTIQLDQAHQPGTCSPNYVWTVIQPISTLGSTCCPEGYKGQQAKILGDLAGVFCCPKADEESPCPEEKRKMPRTPETCPKPGYVVGALCMKYYW